MESHSIGVRVGQAHGLEEFEAGDAGSARAVDHDLYVFDLSTCQMQRVDDAGGRDDGGAVLVVVEDRNVHQLAQPFLDHEAVGRLDVFQIDAAEGGAQIAHRADEVIDVRRVDFQVDGVHVGEALEENGLALHHRLGGERAQIAQPQDRGAVGDHGHEIALGGVVEDGIRHVRRWRARAPPRPGL